MLAKLCKIAIMMIVMMRVEARRVPGADDDENENEEVGHMAQVRPDGGVDADHPQLPAEENREEAPIPWSPSPPPQNHTPAPSARSHKLQAFRLLLLVQTP